MSYYDDDEDERRATYVCVLFRAPNGSDIYIGPFASLEAVDAFQKATGVRCGAIRLETPYQAWEAGAPVWMR